jgi:hypothetical protein
MATEVSPPIKEFGRLEQSRAKELAELIESSWPGYTLTYTWLSEKHGWFYCLEKTTEDFREFVVHSEVIQDSTPKEIIDRLGNTENNWALFLGACQGKITPIFTNQGWRE